jgi:hypothetical protein
LYADLETAECNQHFQELDNLSYGTGIEADSLAVECQGKHPQGVWILTGQMPPRSSSVGNA